MTGGAHFANNLVITYTLTFAEKVERENLYWCN
jgi:hypothetical protein